MLSIFVIASILATTIQVQDFQDVVGDNSIGRKTLPIVFPNGSRYTPIICLVLWSMFLSSVWELSILASLAYASFGTYVGLRFFHKRSVKEDERSYLIYNVRTSFCRSHWRNANIFLRCGLPSVSLFQDTGGCSRSPPRHSNYFFIAPAPVPGIAQPTARMKHLP